MAVPRPHDTPKADPDREWDWSERGAEKTDEIINAGGWRLMVDAHTWYDASGDNPDPPQKKKAYKLPHHEMVNGELEVVWNGVVNAMSVLSGGRGGADIPEHELDEVYNHLAEHYRQFGEEPPELG
jgi:hypothetical protein